MTPTQSQSLTLSRARRGVGMMMVLSVVAAASILSWAMLSAASQRSQLNVNAAAAIESNNLAESGVSYALYYLRYPAKSPVGLTTGAYDTFYGGQTGLRLWSDAGGTVDIVVTNTAKETFRIRSTSTVDGMKQTVEADAKLVMEGYKITAASGINGPFFVPTNMWIDGNVVAKGAVSGSTGQISNSTALVATGADVVPLVGNIALISETGTAASGTGALSTDRTYTYNNNTYFAEKAPAAIVGTLMTVRPTLNPLNVWYSDGSISMSGATVNGTLVLRNAGATLTVAGTNTITGNSGMPALIVANKIDMSNVMTAPAKLTVNGATWVGNKIRGIGTTRSDGLLKFEGSLMFGGGEMKIETITSPIYANYKTSMSNITNLSNVKTIGGINVIRWQNVD